MVPKTILIAVLNWGLGHATRCMPIIQVLLEQGHRLVLASDGDALALLKTEYGHTATTMISFETLPAYKIHYKRANMTWNMGGQLPKILRAIYLERKKTTDIIQKHQIDLIISDNRYGVFDAKIPSVFISHQLHIKVPNKGLEAAVAWLNHRLIRRYRACWVPDWEGEASLAGDLSARKGLESVFYLGPLSRLLPMPVQASVEMLQPIRVAVVLSGPEPQRSYLEQAILEQAVHLPYQFTIVGGKASSRAVEQKTPNIFWQSFMTAAELQELLCQSQVVVARSGYSSLMDLVQLACPRVLLIPTPGQTEQEYLAARCAQQTTFYTQKQADLDLKIALEVLLKRSPNKRKTPVFESAKLAAKLKHYLKDLFNTTI